MRVELQAPIAGLFGTYKNCGMVFTTTKGQTFARARVEPANPRTSEQVKIRSFFTFATRNWKTLTATQREDWLAYAKLYFNRNSRGKEINPQGISAYAKANSIRQVLGLPLTSSAPTLAPPAPVTSIEQEGGQDPNSVAFLVNHGYTTLTGLQLIVRMTPAMESVARSPKDAEYRYIQGASAASAVALPASGSPVTFSSTRYAVNDSERYGIEVRVVRTSDGIMSAPVYGDFFKVI